MESVFPSLLLQPTKAFLSYLDENSAVIPLCFAVSPFSYQPACPSSVSVEISADGVNMLPLSTPVITSGLTYIKIQLVKAEVASAVCLRLHRPRDASTLGLSQIKLLGLTAFGNTSSATVNNPFLPSEDQVSKTRYQKLILD